MNTVYFVLGGLWLGLVYFASAENGNITDFTEYIVNEESQFCDQYYSSCAEINPSVSGVYKIKVGNDVFDVFCDSTIAGRGWTVFQRRVSDEVNFYRKFSSYENGFGDLNGSFWLGLDKLYKITSSEPQELLFKVGDVNSQYTLKSLGTYQGTAGDGLANHLNRPFSTFDKDNNRCANFRLGAWWYKDCQSSNLNALYLGGAFHSDLFGCGVSWHYWRGDVYSLKTVNMMVRPRAT
nr:angiopoietin-related protein 1-like [Drosophila kikkawai]